MAQCLVIADDLTGANATGVLLKKLGFSCDTVMSTVGMEKSIIDSSDCIIFPSNSRAISKDTAYKRVNNICNYMKSDDIAVYSKRIDSTLRGNLGVEIDAMLDSLGEDYIALCVPSFPSSARIVCGGYMLVNGIELVKTSAAKDPKTPITSSIVKNIVEKDSKYKADTIYLDDIFRSRIDLVNKIISLKHNGARIICFDSCSDEDIDIVAEAAIQSGLKFLCVDPGVFTSKVVAKKMKSSLSVMPKNKVLVVIGSVNPVTRSQVEYCLHNKSYFYECVKTKELLLGEEYRNAEIARVVDSVSKALNDYTSFVVYGDGLYPEHRLNLKDFINEEYSDIDKISDIINYSFAQIASVLCTSQPLIRGLYTSGGDITIASYRLMKAKSISLLDEVLPLAAYGKIVGGACEGLRVVTKGGMVGDEKALATSIEYLKNRI